MIYWSQIKYSRAHCTLFCLHRVMPLDFQNSTSKCIRIFFLFLFRTSRFISIFGKTTTNARQIIVRLIWWSRIERWNSTRLNLEILLKYNYTKINLNILEQINMCILYDTKSNSHTHWIVDKNNDKQWRQKYILHKLTTF